MVALIVTLIILGIILLALELLVIPGFGIAGISGIAAFVASIVIGFSHFGTAGGLLVCGGVLLSLLIMTVIILRSGTWKKIRLETKINASVDDIPKNKEYETGMRGIALTRLAPGGKARIGDSEAEVFSRDCIINAGTPVEISEIESNKVFVKPLDMDK